MLRNLGKRDELISLEMITACDANLLSLLMITACDANLLSLLLASFFLLIMLILSMRQRTRNLGDPSGPKPLQLERETQMNSSSYRIFK